MTQTNQNRYSLYLLPISLISAAMQYSPALAGCTATPISQLEAQHLVTLIPQAVTAAQLGGKVEAMQWNPAYGKDLFFYFMLLSTVSPPNTPLDNGMLGYYAVNKLSGRVVEAVVGTETMRGQELESLQANVRAKHCI